MAREPRFSQDEIIDLSLSAIDKIDLLGPAGTAHVTSDEVEAMATLLVLLDQKHDPQRVTETTNERTVR